jgi:hypothetical protein
MERNFALSRKYTYDSLNYNQVDRLAFNYDPGPYIREQLKKIYPDESLYYLDDYVGSCIRITETNKAKLLEDLTLVPFEILEAVRNKKASLVIQIYSESGEGFLDRIYNNLIIANHIPSPQVVLLSGSRDYVELSNIKARSLEIDPVRIIIFDFWEVNMKHRFMQDDLPKTSDLNHIITPLLKPEFKKIYFNLNFTWRPHRIALLTSLSSNDLLECGYNSFVGRPIYPLVYFTKNSIKKPLYRIDRKFEKELSNIIPTINEKDVKWFENILHCTNHFKEPLRSQIINGTDVFSSLPLFLDHPLHAIHGRNVNDTRYLLQFIKNSIFSVITETFFSKKDNFDQIGNKHCRFFTEKTYRAIAYKHPFMLVSLPNSLALLRDMGYKTFDGIIDESYDKEEDDTERMLLILKELKRWKDMNINQINDLRKQMIPIVEHNYDHFINKTDYIYQL